MFGSQEMVEQILGTGLSGLVGSRVVELSPDYQFTDLSLDTGFDILNLGSIEPAFKKFTGDVVMHFAGFTDTSAAWNQKGDKSGLCYRLNVEGTQNVVNLCRKYDKHLIHISTDYVFDGSKHDKYVETDIPNPLDWYGETKLLAEQVVLRSDVSSTIVRIASPYRANFERKADLVRKILTKLQQGQACNLFNDQVTTPTLIDDIAFGMTKIIEAKPGGIYHLVASSTQTVYQMGLLIAKTFGFDPKLIEPSSLSDYLKTPNARPYAINLGLSNQKFTQEFDFIPRNLTQGLQELKQQLSLPLLLQS